MHDTAVCDSFVLVHLLDDTAIQPLHPCKIWVILKVMKQTTCVQKRLEYDIKINCTVMGYVFKAVIRLVSAQDHHHVVIFRNVA